MCHASETFVFSSDWPHHTFNIPNWLFTNPHLDDELRSNVLREIAEELFGI